MMAAEALGRQPQNCIRQQPYNPMAAS